MKGVDEVDSDEAATTVIDMDAAKGNQAAATEETKKPTEAAQQEQPKGKEEVKADKQPLRKVTDEPEKVVDDKKVPDEKDQAPKVESEAKTEEQPKSQEASDEFANPDEVVFDVDGKDVSATEIFHRYQDATDRLASIEKDEWLKKFVDYRLKGGDPLAYLQTQTRDWAKVKEIDLLREAFYEGPAAEGLDDESREELFARELSDKYGSSIDGTYEDETTKVAKLGKQLMKRDAEKVRAGKLEQQKSFSLPKAEEKKPVQATFDPAKEREALLKNEEVKSFVENKLVRIGDTEFGHEVENPEKVIEMMTDTRNFWKLFAKEGGGTDWDRLQKTMAFAMNPSAYDATVLALGRNLGEEKYLKEKKNIKTPSEVNQERGADTGGFNKLDFLKELKRQNPNL